MFKLSTILATVSLFAAPIVSAAAAEKPVSIVLVHGAFVDGSGWQKVYQFLKKDGYDDVIVVQNPTETLDGDVAVATRAIARAKYPVVLVGHSYGGAVITEAGNDPKVRSLVYIAAFAPDDGESVSSLIAEPNSGASQVPILPPQDGFLMLDVSKFPASFAPDADKATSSFMAVSQVPWGQAAVATKITQAAWKSKPTFFMVTTKDHMIATAQQREMAARAHATTTEISSSHAVMLSHPREVTTFIEQIASKSP